MKTKFFILIIAFFLFLFPSFLAQTITPGNIELLGAHTVAIESHDNWTNFGEQIISMELVNKEINGRKLWFNDKVIDYIGVDNTPSQKSLSLRLNVDNPNENLVFFRQNLPGGILNIWKLTANRAVGAQEGYAIKVIFNNKTECNLVVNNLSYVGTKELFFDDCGIVVEVDKLFLSTQADIRINGFGVTQEKMNSLLSSSAIKVSSDLLEQMRSLRDLQSISPNSLTGLRTVSLAVNDQFISVDSSDELVNNSVYLSIHNFLFKKIKGLDHLIIFDQDQNVKVILIGNWVGNNSIKVYTPKLGVTLKLEDVKDYENLMNLLNFSSDKLIEFNGVKLDNSADFLASWSIGSEVASYIVPMVETGVFMRGGAIAAMSRSTSGAATIPSRTAAVVRPHLPGAKIYVKDSTMNNLKTMFEAIGRRETLAEVQTYLTTGSSAHSVYGRYILKVMSKEASKRGATIESVKKAAEQLSKRFVQVETTKLAVVGSNFANSSTLIASEFVDVGENVVGQLDLADIGKNNKFVEVNPVGEIASIGTSASIAGVATGVCAVISGATVAAGAAVAGSVALGVIVVGAGIAVPIWYYADSDTYLHSSPEYDQSIYLTKVNNFRSMTLEQLSLRSESIDLEFEVEIDSSLEGDTITIKLENFSDEWVKYYSSVWGFEAKTMEEFVSKIYVNDEPSPQFFPLVNTGNEDYPMWQGTTFAVGGSKDQIGNNKIWLEGNKIKIFIEKGLEGVCEVNGKCYSQNLFLYFLGAEDKKDYWPWDLEVKLLNNN